jgi:hypothetical protein
MYRKNNIGNFIMKKCLYVLAALFIFPFSAMAEGELGLGVQGDGWNSNYPTQNNGYDILVPLTLAYKANPNVNLYGQTEFASGSYTDSVSGTETINLNNISDTVVGGEVHFKTGSLPSIVNIGINLPTGDPTWETKEIASSIPTEFVDSRYRGRGLGFSALYGISLPEGKGEYGVAGGFLYSGAFNPSYGLNAGPNNSLNLGDAAFLALNHVQPHSEDENEIVRFSVYQSFPSAQNGQNVFELGTNFNASYNWSNPKAFSFELGAQAYLPSERANNLGYLVQESSNSYCPRFYITPSYAFGDFVVAAEAKYIMQNDYSPGNLYYDGGGWLLSLTPSYRFKLDDASSFKVLASFTDVYALNLGPYNGNVNSANVNFNLWTVSTSYEMKL